MTRILGVLASFHALTRALPPCIGTHLGKEGSLFTLELKAVAHQSAHGFGAVAGHFAKVRGQIPPSNHEYNLEEQEDTPLQQGNFSGQNASPSHTMLTKWKHWNNSQCGVVVKVSDYEPRDSSSNQIPTCQWSSEGGLGPNHCLLG